MPTTDFTKSYQHSLLSATPERKLEPILSVMLYQWLTRRKAEPLYSPKVHTLYQALLWKEGGTSIKCHVLLITSRKETDPLSKILTH
ncbi:hypothetical protein CsSME_00043578 [Camellia sinensis var. sinensis]